MAVRTEGNWQARNTSVHVHARRLLANIVGMQLLVFVIAGGIVVLLGWSAGMVVAGILSLGVLYFTLVMVLSTTETIVEEAVALSEQY